MGAVSVATWGSPEPIRFIGNAIINHGGNAKAPVVPTSGGGNFLEWTAMRWILRILGFSEPIQIIGKNEAMRRILAKGEL